jgi:hypothetical protein
MYRAVFGLSSLGEEKDHRQFLERKIAVTVNDGYACMYLKSYVKYGIRSPKFIWAHGLINYCI